MNNHFRAGTAYPPTLKSCVPGSREERVVHEVVSCISGTLPIISLYTEISAKKEGCQLLTSHALAPVPVSAFVQETPLPWFDWLHQPYELKAIFSPLVPDISYVTFTLP
jgi:hypothetical protein